MKRTMQASLSAAAVLALASGCATTQRDTSLDNVDSQKVASIDHIAESRGVQVRWLNYPQRHASTSEAVATPAPAGT